MQLQIEISACSHYTPNKLRSISTISDKFGQVQTCFGNRFNIEDFLPSPSSPSKSSSSSEINLNNFSLNLDKFGQVWTSLDKTSRLVWKYRVDQQCCPGGNCLETPRGVSGGSPNISAWTTLLVHTDYLFFFGSWSAAKIQERELSFFQIWKLLQIIATIFQFSPE